MCVCVVHGVVALVHIVMGAGALSLTTVPVYFFCLLGLMRLHCVGAEDVTEQMWVL